MSSKRFVCIHGHFYQPPRENPWLEEIETQEGAAPFHDWNELVNAECYAQNATSRLLHEHGLIRDIRNNYRDISFNFGATLLSWMEKSDPVTYRAILDADRDSVTANSGHGNAIAQIYNHVIMPLASSRDKRTQIIWGIRDFQHRFNREPEGMWLAETAVDTDSLEALAECGIKFTILAPYQAAKFRKIGDEEWLPLDQGFDLKRPYQCNLPSGKSIAIFYYDGQVAQDVAFKDLLKDGAKFANRLIADFDMESDRPQLVHFATDGETYGHHHHFGDMALAFAINYLKEHNLAEVTNYAAFLADNPPQYEVQIAENTSWSCAHGIERWRSDCGCSLGRDPAWNQQWRAGLRDSLEWLRTELETIFEREGSQHFDDSWRARNDYISVILNRSRDNVRSFLESHSNGALDEAVDIKRLQLLELQRQGLLMFTSCGWFFDEISEVQTVQVIRYAGRAIQLAKKVCGADLEEHFLDMLAVAKSNLLEIADGKSIYLSDVKPLHTDMHRVGAHYAVMSLFEDFPRVAQIYCYDVERLNLESSTAGRIKLITGEVHIRSRITWRNQRLGIAALHIGGFDFSGGVKDDPDSTDWQEFTKQVQGLFDSGDMTSVISCFDNFFNSGRITFADLFAEDRRHLAKTILDETVEQADQAFERVYDDNAGIIRYIARLGLPVPSALKSAAERALKRAVLDELSKELPSSLRLEEIDEEAGLAGIKLDDWRLAPALLECVSRMAVSLQDRDLSMESLSQMPSVISGLKRLNPEVNLWQLQNAYHQRRLALTEVDRADEEFITSFNKLGAELHFKD
ncbi:DUF3536 domain-containing protein [Calditrichota bacterium]